MKKEKRFRVCYPFMSTGEHCERRYRVIYNAKQLFAFMQVCHNNKFTDDCGETVFAPSQLQFTYHDGGVCDIGHFHILDWDLITDKPLYFNDEIVLYENWAKESKQTYNIYLKTKQTADEHAIEIKEKEEYLRLKKKYENQ